MPDLLIAIILVGVLLLAMLALRRVNNAHDHRVAASTKFYRLRDDD